MHRRCFRKVVVYDDADSVTLGDLNRRPRSSSVVTPEIDDLARDNFLLHRFGDEMELFHVSIQAEREVRGIRRLNRNRNDMSVLRRLGFSSSFHLHSAHPLRQLHLLVREDLGGSEYAGSR